MIVTRNAIILAAFSQAVLLAAAVRVYVTEVSVFRYSAVPVGFCEAEFGRASPLGENGKREMRPRNLVS